MWHLCLCRGSLLFAKRGSGKVLILLHPYVGDSNSNIQKEVFYKVVLGIDEENGFKEAISDKEQNYQKINVSRKGKLREIQCIDSNKELYRLQSNLTKNFLNKISLPENVCGFVKGRSYKDFLVPHINSSQTDRYYLRLDIKNFFDSITEEKLKQILTEYITIPNDEEKQQVLKDILDIVTLNGTLPQGGVTSPVLSNIVFRKLDIRIRQYCRKLNITYSRYADDMLFSSRSEKLFNGFFIKMIVKILKSSGFTLNRKKIKKGTSYISLNGFVVGKNIRISRKKRQDINQFIFLYEKDGNPRDTKELIRRLGSVEFNYRKKGFHSNYSIINYLAGYRSMLISWLPEELDEKWYQEAKKLLDKIEKMIEKIECLA